MSQETLIAQRYAEKQRLSALIEDFAETMKARAFQKVDEGYTGWDRQTAWGTSSPEGRLLDEAEVLDEGHIDPATHSRKCVDAANFSMFAWARDGWIADHPR